MAKLKANELNKNTILIKHGFRYEHRINCVNFKILNFNIDFEKKIFLNHCILII